MQKIPFVGGNTPNIRFNQILFAWVQAINFLAFHTYRFRIHLKKGKLYWNGRERNTFFGKDGRIETMA